MPTKGRLQGMAKVVRVILTGSRRYSFRSSKGLLSKRKEEKIIDSVKIICK